MNARKRNILWTKSWLDCCDVHGSGVVGATVLGRCTVVSRRASLAVTNPRPPTHTGALARSSIVQFPVLRRRLPRDWVTDWYLGEQRRSGVRHFGTLLHHSSSSWRRQRRELRRLGATLRCFVTTLSHVRLSTSCSPSVCLRCMRSLKNGKS